jgi:hypothetical protein
MKGFFDMSQPNREEALRRFKARHGHLPGEAKPAAAAEVLASMTPAQRRAAEEAIQSRQVSGRSNSGATYAGPDFQSLVEELRERKGISYADAYCATLKSPQGQAAHRAFLKAKNPHADFGE